MLTAEARTVSAPIPLVLLLWHRSVRGVAFSRPRETHAPPEQAPAPNWPPRRARSCMHAPTCRACSGCGDAQRDAHMRHIE